MKQILLLIFTLSILSCESPKAFHNSFTYDRIMYGQVLVKYKHAIILQDIVDRDEYKICFQDKTTDSINLLDKLRVTYYKDKYSMNNLIAYEIYERATDTVFRNE